MKLSISRCQDYLLLKLVDNTGLCQYVEKDAFDTHNEQTDLGYQARYITLL